MRRDTIVQAIPHADPDFIRIIEKLTEPMPAVYEQVFALLPELHVLFLRKREAAAHNKTQDFLHIIDQEVALLERLEKTAKTT